MKNFEELDINKLNKEIDKEIKKCKACGVAVALFDDSKVLYQYEAGFSNKEKEQEVDENTLFMIGSNGKILTALAIFKLREQGLLHLDDDVRKFIPEFEVQADFYYDKITIEHLLMHRSGLVSDFFNLKSDGTRNLDIILEEIRHSSLTTLPSKMYSYSNVGYTVLGIVIERISGKKYTDYIEEEIAKPLGIEILYLDTKERREAYSSRLSLNYDINGNPVEDFISDLIYLPSGASCYMSLKDFRKFAQGFLNSDNGVISENSLIRMEQLNGLEEVDNHLLNVGYGLIHNNYVLRDSTIKVLGHGGDTFTHHSMFNYLPHHNLGVVTLTNSANASRLSRKIGILVTVAYLQKNGLDLDDFSVEEAHLKGGFDHFIGRYATSLGLIDITKKHGSLVTKVGKLDIKFEPCEDGYLHCLPNTLLGNLPNVKNQIKSLRIKLVPYFDEEVMTLKVTNKKYTTEQIIGTRYIASDIPNSFRTYLGEYLVYEDIYANSNLSLKIYEEDCALKLNLETGFDMSIELILRVIDDNTAVTCGFGRFAKEQVYFEQDFGKSFVTVSGIKFKKID